ncbi:MAG: hypothetical protein V3V61_05620, partial [Gammaproteobacteria bacterium]
AQAHELDVADIETMMQYAQALYFVQAGDLKGQPRILLEEIIEKVPDHTEALNLMAAGAYQQEDYVVAADYWQRALNAYPYEDENKEALREALATAQKQLQQANNVVQQEDSAVQLDVRVQIADAVSALVVPEDTVYLYAKAVDGPPMPLAVVQMQVKDLPQIASLDDSLAMMPAARLSQFAQVVIYARVAKAGQAEAQSGDLIGQSVVVNVAEANERIEIIIDSVVT